MNEKQTCENCNASLWAPNGHQGICRANPPTMVFIGMSKPQPLAGNIQLPGGQTVIPSQPMLSSNFPPVQRGWWCRQWQETVSRSQSYTQACTNEDKLSI